MISKKVAQIIGAGENLGSSIAIRFSKEGFHSVGTRRRGDITSLVEKIKNNGGDATGIHSDARKENQVVELVEHVEKNIGPIEVLVFNVGGNVMFPILETTSKVYKKTWEMCALAGFLSGREVAKRMVDRKKGTILFTGATASIRGNSEFSAFSGGKHALRALAQSMAKELMPHNIHVAHIVIDGLINTEWTRERFPNVFKERPDDGLLQPEDIAETYWSIHNQKRSAWTF